MTMTSQIVHVRLHARRRLRECVRPLVRTFAAAALIACAQLASAQLRVEITGVGAQQIPIAIANFAHDGPTPEEVDGIIRANLMRSGLFRIVDAGGSALSETSEVKLADFKARGADALVVGSTTRLANGNFDVRFLLYDTVKSADLREARLDGNARTVAPARMRLAAHEISDAIYEKLTGDKGVFATRIAYVLQLAKNTFELKVADADGENAQTALPSKEAIMSPAWSPDGTRLAYVSFETGKPVVYVQTLTTAERRAVANYRGSNSAPAWTPDGKTLVVALSRDGSTQLYAINADGSGTPRRLTNSGAIDTEPMFSPDGKFIYFTSDRGGGPQIYRMTPDGSGVTRVTFNGDYNVTPRISPDGRILAFVNRADGRFQVKTLDLASGQELTLTDTVMDESPSFAPNGRLLLYATEAGGRGILATASLDGRTRVHLPSARGNVREPCWGPFVK